MHDYQRRIKMADKDDLERIMNDADLTPAAKRAMRKANEKKEAGAGSPPPPKVHGSAAPKQTPVVEL